MVVLEAVITSAFLDPPPAAFSRVPASQCSLLATSPLLMGPNAPASCFAKPTGLASGAAGEPSGQNRALVPARRPRSQNRTDSAPGRLSLFVPPPLPCKKCLVTASARPRRAGEPWGKREDLGVWGCKALPETTLSDAELEGI
ncbi:hypothetical protein P7K49_034409 [Saguinus oedipus]|uniref:Uncharacterized protein n=1 Tax=Saguinus oedipus TaxID=9490 RepID=A0ABQ9TUM9_SAGOE|nr:hypothetical protein P7K49_034409 [Saguinus oedipus]